MMDKYRPGTKVAEELLTAPAGATMAEIRKATGGPQYNVLSKLEGRGYTIRKVKEGHATRYFAVAPGAPAFEVTVTSQGQITVPKEIRERLSLHAGSKLRLVLENDHRVVMAPVNLSITRLFGILGKPPRSATLEQMDEGIRRAAVDRYLRSKR
jgi:antitoxin PrlF